MKLKVIFLLLANIIFTKQAVSSIPNLFVNAANEKKFFLSECNDPYHPKYHTFQAIKSQFPIPYSCHALYILRNNIYQMNLVDENISDIRPFNYFKNLRVLILNKNSITTLHPLHNLKKIKILKLSKNQITDISGISYQNR